MKNVSKNQARKAGKLLVRDLLGNYTETPNWQDAYTTLSDWRAMHVRPMQIILMRLRRKAPMIDQNVVIVQRLKRVNSILYKLYREPKMCLDRMEDIGGCRAILDSNENVRLLKDQLVESDRANEITRLRDYIETPKTSGYRGIHIVYKHNKGSKATKGLTVEVQLRTKIQHSWATAVEVVGTFTSQSLKADRGNKDWLDFFKYASAEFAKLENYQPVDTTTTIDSKSKLIFLTEKLNVETRLRQFVTTTRALDDEAGKSQYFLLDLNVKKNTTVVEIFSSDQRSEATHRYAHLERGSRARGEEDDRDIVLVNADSIAGLRRAYPNYFADTVEFTKYLIEITGNNN